MHELAVCRALLAEATRVATDRGASSIARIVVTIGPLSGVEAALLDRAFSVARLGTLAEDAALEVEHAAVVVACGTCGKESPVPANALTCPGCGDWRVRVIGGNELLLRRIELCLTTPEPDRPACGEAHV